MKGSESVENVGFEFELLSSHCMLEQAQKPCASQLAFTTRSNNALIM